MGYSKIKNIINTLKIRNYNIYIPRFVHGLLTKYGFLGNLKTYNDRMYLWFEKNWLCGRESTRPLESLLFFYKLNTLGILYDFWVNAPGV